MHRTESERPCLDSANPYTNKNSTIWNYPRAGHGTKGDISLFFLQPRSPARCVLQEGLRRPTVEMKNGPGVGARFDPGQAGTDTIAETDILTDQHPRLHVRFNGSFFSPEGGCVGIARQQP